MKRLLLFVFLVGSLSAFSQDTIKIGNWMIHGKVSFNVSQAYFSNWAAGGVSNFTTIGKYTMIANYKKDKHSFNNYLDLALGYTIFLEGKPMKTEDKIEYLPAYRYELHKHWYFSVLGKFASQFAPGYEYDIDSTNYVSKFLAPAWIDVGPGITYQPVDWFWVNVSPVNPAFIVVNDQRLADEGIFGLTPADTVGNIIKHADRVKYMFGAKLTSVLNYEIFKNINLGTKLELFSDYLNNPQNIDVNWQVLFGLKVNDWLNVDLQTTLLYDDDIMITDKDGNIGPRAQFRQLLLISVGYAF
jgi:hypothetical protein